MNIHDFQTLDDELKAQIYETLLYFDRVHVTLANGTVSYSTAIGLTARYAPDHDTETFYAKDILTVEDYERKMLLARYGRSFDQEIPPWARK